MIRKINPKLRKATKRKNPKDSNARLAKEILNEADEYEYLTEGSEGEIFYFSISTPITADGHKLLSGKYVLKIFNRPMTSRRLEFLSELSDKKLIPEIYVFDFNYLIMDYIDGKTLKSVIENLSRSSKDLILKEIEKLISKWHKYKIGHGDLQTINIMISGKKVYFIDPLANYDGIITNKQLMGNDLGDLKHIERLMTFYD